MFYHPYYLQYWWLGLPGILLAMYAQFRLSVAHSEYVEEPIQSGVSGAEAARQILDRAGLTYVRIEEIPGQLTDHFDPTRQILSLSTANYQGRSIAAVGVAAHEAGHALQQQAGMALLNLRMWLAPATQFATSAAYGIFMVGYLFGGALSTTLLLIGIILYVIITVFQVVTLPVEYDASRRAKEQLLQLGLVQPDEAPAVRRMLSAAALTYVAAMITAFLQLLRLIMLFNRRRD